jgi:hypothetical protein
MKVSITREIVLDDDEIGLLKLLKETGQEWSYACEEFEEHVFESLGWKRLINEDMDGRAQLSADGYNALAMVEKASQNS